MNATQKKIQELYDSIIVATPQELRAIMLDISFAPCSAYDRAWLTRIARDRALQFEYAEMAA